jgi:hypothetical protein
MNKTGLIQFKITKILNKPTNRIFMNSLIYQKINHKMIYKNKIILRIMIQMKVQEKITKQLIKFRKHMMDLVSL